MRAATHQLNVLARLVLELHATAAGPDAERLDEHVLARDDVAAGEGREARGGNVGEELLAEVVDRGHGAAGEDDGARDIDDGAERRLGVEQEVAERDRQRAGAGGDADEDAAVAIGVAQRQQERLQPMEDVD